MLQAKMDGCKWVCMFVSNLGWMNESKHVCMFVSNGCHRCNNLSFVLFISQGLDLIRTNNTHVKPSSICGSVIGGCLIYHTRQVGYFHIFLNLILDGGYSLGIMVKIKKKTLNTYIHKYIHICTHIHMYTCIYTYIHTGNNIYPT